DLSGFCSFDGTNWQWVGTERIKMPAQVQIGLAVTSSKENALCLARFAQVSVQSVEPNLGPVTGVGEGLLGSYGPKGSTNIDHQISQTINFHWNSLDRLWGPGTGSFSTVWEGYVEAQFSEPYAFQLVHHQCARLWVDGKLIIDHCGKSGFVQAKAVLS